MIIGIRTDAKVQGLNRNEQVLRARDGSKLPCSAYSPTELLKIARERPNKSHDMLVNSHGVKRYVCTFNFRMENLDTYIANLSAKVEKLVRMQSELQSENLKLKGRNEELELVVNDQKNVLSRLEEQNKVVKIAKAVTDDDEDRKEQRKRLNELVREVDKCIALLNN